MAERAQRIGRITNIAVPVVAASIDSTRFGQYGTQPLLKCGFCFYPQSRTWRRARASRDKVTRQHVAKRAGVSESAILSWEEAACAALKGRDGTAR